jgi:integrase
LHLAGADHLLVMATRNGTPVGQENYRRDLKTTCRRADLPEITPYELRHTAITHQIEAGKDIVDVADWAGTSVQMIERHYRHKIRRVNRLDPPDYGPTIGGDP